ncbi:glycosyl transferase [Pseudodesulfovibrio sediminis]|uniref:Glycosyl transferase n=2 Tax=Pseudodesulfovibrio sediminis TaxID=2810563 RepID=A0ABN6ESC9_9BACT|nr:glycosyl transferase [Pseudodesulfovibrio sediminis]
MHIAFINSTRSWGGVKTWTVDYATELVARDHGVTVFARQSEFIATLKDRGIDARQANFGFDFNPLTIGRFIAAFLRTRPDIVICNINKDMNTAGVAARLLGIPVVQRVGMPRDMESNSRVTFLIKLLKPWFLCPSHSVANGVRTHLPFVPEDRIKVIHNAKKPVDAIRPVQSGPLQLISTSQVNKDKHHQNVLDALETLPPDSFQYHIVGTGKLVESLREQHRKLEKRGSLVWHGFTTDVQAHLRNADVFLLPSNSEGMPNALLEAMAMGLIPVSRDIGGVSEIWPDSLAHLMVPPSAGHEEFRNTIDSLLKLDNDALNALKGLSLNACRTTFNLPTKIDEFERWVEDNLLGR